MTTLTQTQTAVSIEDYLEGEQHTDIKHEYLGGQIVAMGGASDRHGLIGLSLAALLHPHARSKACQLFMGDMKVRVDHDGDSYFYYPDLLLSCNPADKEHAYYRRHPCLLVEVLSPTTERIDTREKLLAYQSLPSLQAYLLVEQEARRVELYRRATDWRVEYHDAGEIWLDCLELALPLAEVYADV